MSPRQAVGKLFGVSFLSSLEIEILVHFSFSTIKLWVFEVFIPNTDDSFDWESTE